jgi:hypothetical protein
MRSRYACVFSFDKPRKHLPNLFVWCRQYVDIYGANECRFIPSAKANIALQLLKLCFHAAGIASRMIAGTLVTPEECLDVRENFKIAVIIS